jgi:hypothetical protein
LGEEAVADLDGKEGESEEIVEFQPIADAHGYDLAQRQVLLFEWPCSLFIRERCVHPPPVGSTAFLCRGELSSCTIAHCTSEEVMLLSLQSRLCGNIFVIHCQGRIDALDATAILLQLFGVQPQSQA